MQEKFLYHVWEFQYFHKHNLYTSSGEKIDIISPGEKNNNSGPDFLNAQICINNIIWHGHIELHTNSSDWYLHSHHLDKSYENVILHAVWNNDKTIAYQNGYNIPTLEFKNIVYIDFYKKYYQFERSKLPIPCSNQLQKVPNIIKNGMLDKVLYQRLETKHDNIYKYLKDNNEDWQETAYQILAHTLGLKTNSLAFLTLTQNLPLKFILKEQPSIFQLEALLFGVSGILSASKSNDAYVQDLKKEYEFLTHKNSILRPSMSISQWKFFRLRPVNFPTIRIAQLAQILNQNQDIFDLLTNTPIKILYKKLKVQQSHFWQNHYTFDKKSNKKISGFGTESINSIITNAIVPLLTAYGKAKDNQDYIDRAATILEYLPAEKNSITKLWIQNGLKIKNAFDSQASIELYNNFCSKKNCLNCNIGLHILRKKEEK